MDEKFRLHSSNKLERFVGRVSHFTMDSDDECAAAAVVVAILIKKRKRLRKKRERSVWVKPWLSRRNELGADRTLLREFRLEDDEEYKKFLRMSPEISTNS